MQRLLFYSVCVCVCVCLYIAFSDIIFIMKESGKIKKLRQLEINSNMNTVDMILKSTLNAILLIYS